MTSEHAFSGPGADGWHIGPAFGPAVLVGTLAVPSAVAAWFNGLPWSLRAAVLLLVVVLAARAIKRLLRPQIIRIKISGDRKSTRLNSSHVAISYAVFCLKKK